MATQQIVLVTGGSRGLGKDMALRLAERGLDVVLTYHSKEAEAQSVVEAIKGMGQQAAALQLDTATGGTFTDFVEQLRPVLTDFGGDRLDYFVNNAGIGIYAPYAETTEEQFDQLLNIQFRGPFFLTQALLPILRDGGGIVNISTGLARFCLPGYAAYGAMKGAMEVLSRYQAVELGERKIRSNVVAPGAIETDFSGGAVRDNEQLNQMVSSITALGRAGQPDDIGGVVAFLCTDDARWINAQRIEVSGGMKL